MFLFSFKGQIQRLPYALLSLAVFLSQHVVVLVAGKVVGQPLGCVGLVTWDVQPLICDGLFALMPLRSVVGLGHASTWLLVLTLAYWLVASWSLAALAFRRAADAGIAEWVAAFVIAPIVQIPAILVLCILPSRARTEPSAAADQASERRLDWVAGAQGVLAGIGLTLASVAVGALVFGSYGFGMFVVSPFVIGATAGYLANRRGNVGSFRTALVVTIACALGGIALVAVALEGLVCIILGAPLGLGVALLGGLFGREVALYSTRSGRQTLSSFALLPLVFAVESVVSPSTAFDTRETIIVDAPAAMVWNAIVNMDPLDEPTALPFRLGVAYPRGGRIVGEGIGATRFGEFSTGTAVERITDWLPGRKLAFTVISGVPAMRELSPYQNVHAPHVVGYFTTMSTSFELLPQSDGRTKIVEESSHRLRLDPIFYWLPFARLIIHENNARVLAHIRAQSERDFRM